jgi:hypothetical protein
LPADNFYFGSAVLGSAYLKDGGHYEDVYVKTSNGWRFKSRTYRPS